MKRVSARALACACSALPNKQVEKLVFLSQKLLQRHHVRKIAAGPCSGDAKCVEANRSLGCPQPVDTMNPGLS